MKPTVRAWPFESKYLRDFAVVEECRGKLRLFRATEQLPLLSKVIDQEFKAGLTTRLATTDERGDMWRKLQLWKAGTAFCSYLNGRRPDHLHVQPYYTPACVTQIAVVQRITEVTAAGNHHWFRFFHGAAFLPDIFLAGKRIVFASHAIDRYDERANATSQYGMNRLVTLFFFTVPVIMKLNGHSDALVFDAGHSMAVMPYDVAADRLLCRTTLTPLEITSLEAIDNPPLHAHFHYGPTAPVAPFRNFDLPAHTARFVRFWQDKVPVGDITKAFTDLQQIPWIRHVQLTEPRLRAEGYDENSKLEFYDGIHGPSILTGPKQTRLPIPVAPQPTAPPPGTPIESELTPSTAGGKPTPDR